MNKAFWTRQGHGGDIAAAARAYGIPAADWLDLSTGINPEGWPLPALNESAIRRLPTADDRLVAAAQDYYGGAAPVPAAGSQALIALLPWLWPALNVGLPRPGYREHELAWRRAGHRPCYYDPRNGSALMQLIDSGRIDAAVVIQPHNPLGTTLSPALLLEAASRLAHRGGVLVVDEAFIDTQPALSLGPFANRPGLVVLRSLGKFFGLAGIRLGFALADPGLRRRLRSRLGPWAISGPAVCYGEQALRDSDWQQAARLRLDRRSEQMRNWLAGELRTAGANISAAVPAAAIAGPGLFVSAELDQLTALRLADRWARRGVLLRVYRQRQRAILRVGLTDDRGWNRLHSTDPVAALDSVAR